MIDWRGGERPEGNGLQRHVLDRVAVARGRGKACLHRLCARVRVKYVHTRNIYPGTWYSI